MKVEILIRKSLSLSLSLSQSLS